MTSLQETRRELSPLYTKMTCKRVILMLFGALDESILPLSKLVKGASLFNLDSPSVRMAVNRLTKEGILSSAGRGKYKIGYKGAALHSVFKEWNKYDNERPEWSGGWIVVHTAHLGRTNRSALRARNRALTINGFSQLESELWIRPNNIPITVDALIQKLYKLGLSKKSIIFSAFHFEGHALEKLNLLWDRAKLEHDYRLALTAMKESEKCLESCTVSEAASETIEVGSKVIGLLTHDPFLPSSFVDASLRKEVYEAMMDYSKLGKKIWAKFLDQN